MISGYATLYFDGACKRNPGEGAGGWILSTRECTIGFGWNYLEKCTNNEAEYTGLIKGLEFVHSLPDPLPFRTLHVLGDSLLIIKQVIGENKCRARNLMPFNQRAIELIALLRTRALLHFEWVQRDDNKLADLLTNIGVDRKYSAGILLDKPQLITTMSELRSYCLC